MARYPLALVLLLSLLYGCGHGTQLAELNGVVKFKGKPIHNVQVLFLPEPDKNTGGSRSTGVTNNEGRFQLQTDEGKKGAVIGPHRVLIRDLNMYGEANLKTLGRLSEAEAAKLPPSRIPMIYSDSFKTPLRVEVKAGQKEIELIIDPKAGG